MVEAKPAPAVVAAFVAAAPPPRRAKLAGLDAADDVTAAAAVADATVKTRMAGFARIGGGGTGQRKLGAGVIGGGDPI